MLDKVVKCTKMFGVQDALFEYALTIDDNITLLGDLSNYFAGDSEFDEDIFNLLEKWVKKYVEEN